MILNDRLIVVPGEDPFMPQDLWIEPTYTPLHWERALKEGGEVTRYTVERLRQAGILERFEQRLALRNDRFSLTERSGPQDWHFDPPIPFPFRFFSWSGLIAYGKDTGETDVLNPFDSVIVPSNSCEQNTLPTLLGCGDIPFPGYRSFPTGTLLHSTVPFIHRRGRTLPGVRCAIDFGLLSAEQLKYE